MFEDLTLTAEKVEKINRKIEVLRMKASALAAITSAFEKYDGKVLNKRVFDGVKAVFNTPRLSVAISSDWNNGIEMSLYGKDISYYEGQFLFYRSSVKIGNRLDFATLKAESDKLIDQYNQRATDSEKALKTVKSALKKAKKAYETLKAVSDALPYEVREEFKLLKTVY